MYKIVVLQRDFDPFDAVQVFVDFHHGLIKAAPAESTLCDLVAFLWESKLATKIKAGAPNPDAASSCTRAPLARSAVVIQSPLARTARFANPAFVSSGRHCKAAGCSTARSAAVGSAASGRARRSGTSSTCGH